MICPTRTIDGQRGGRSTYGVCKGALSWQVERGHLAEVGLSGMRVVVAYTYDDDETGSPWRFWLYVDERGDAEQRRALERIFLGEAGGSPRQRFPWVQRQSERLGVRAAPIYLDHERGDGWVRIAGHLSVLVGGAAEVEAEVTSPITGSHQPGRELNVELLRVEDEGLDFSVRGRCGFESEFEYLSSDA